MGTVLGGMVALVGIFLMTGRAASRRREDPDGPALDDLVQFVSAFSFRDVTNDRELSEVVNQIQQLARGVDVPQLRSDDELRARVERETSRLEGHLDRRRLDRTLR